MATVMKLATLSYSTALGARSEVHVRAGEDGGRDREDVVIVHSVVTDIHRERSEDGSDLVQHPIPYRSLTQRNSLVRKLCRDGLEYCMKRKCVKMEETASHPSPNPDAMVDQNGGQLRCLQVSRQGKQ